MQVILLERIEKLGQMGDVVTVKPGYARNYLLPQKKALRATDENKRYFDAQKAQLEARNLELKKEAEGVAGKMDGAAVILVRQAGEAGQLYGSVNARDVADALTVEGFSVARAQVELPKPIKTLGLHDVSVRLHPEVTVTVTANVARSEEEAKIQTETGAAVVGGVEQETVEDAAHHAAEALVAHAEEVFEEGTVEEVVAEVEAEEEVIAAAEAAEEAQAAESEAEAEVETEAEAEAEEEK